MRSRRSVPALTAALCLTLIAAGVGAAHATTGPSPDLAAEGASIPLVVSTAAEGDPEVLTEHRQGVMRATSGHMAALAAILLDGAPFEENLALHGTALAGLLADIPALFPEGSEHPESDALPETWSDWDTFVDRAGTTGERAASLGEATQGGDRMAMIQAFQALGESCGACHESFRN